MTKQRQSDEYSVPLVDRGVRSGTVLRIILLALVLIAAAAAFVIFKNSLDNEMVLGALGILAMVGIFFLVSSVIGFVEVMPQTQSDSLARSFLNSHPDGTLITDEKGRIVYANAAYGDLTGAKKTTDVQSLETLLSRNRESNEALYRLSNGLR
jgi:two-component system cell cycle sensor histidine kinase/response regulator CckA